MGFSHSNIPFFRKAAPTEDDEYKESSQNYYTLAHSTRESIKEQPEMMCHGQLKEYQVSAGYQLCR